MGVIAKAGAQFHAGLTVLTGETGAGKTMVLTSLHLLSGARADAGRVRVGADRAVVEGRFTLDDVNPAAVADVERVLESTGERPTRTAASSRCGPSAPTAGPARTSAAAAFRRAMLAEFTDSLLTVHGQNDQLRLLRPEQQRKALDQFAIDTVGPLLARYTKIRQGWLDARNQLVERTEKSRELAGGRPSEVRAERDRDRRPQPGEDAAIVNEVRRLSDLDSLREAAAGAQALLLGASADIPTDADGAARPARDRPIARRRKRRPGTVDPRSTARRGDRRRHRCVVGVDDLPLRPAVGPERPRLTAQPAGGAEATDSQVRCRCRRCSRLVRPGGPTFGEHRHLRRCARRTGTASRYRRRGIGSRRNETHRRPGEGRERNWRRRSAPNWAAWRWERRGSRSRCGRPPAGPQDSAPLFVDGVELHAGSSGTDEVEFRMSAHSGAQSLPIAKSASGGELSRVMLALRGGARRHEKGVTMVFDEVDAGVGGRAAVEIGRRLARLARTHQVIVVTHLPQVAAFADTHLVVSKSDNGKGLVNSGVQTLGTDERVVELARMLAGLDDTSGRAHAEELLELASAERS